MPFRLLNKNLKFPELYPKVDRKDPTVNDKGWDRVGDFTLRDKIDFMPQKGLQEKFCACECNLIFIGGAATSGKTYSMFLKFLQGVGEEHQGYTGRIISVRLQDSKKGSSIFRDAVEVCGNFGGCEYNSSDYPTFVWKRYNASLQLIHANFNSDNPSEWDEFKDFIKKQQASYIAIDEATEIKQFKMFNYIFSRNRDSSGMTPCMALSFNPEHKHFTTTMLRDAGYLDENWYLRSDMDGVVKYFYMAGDSENDIIWGDTPEEVIARAGITISDSDRKAGITERDIVKSFTMISGEASGNLKLVSATKGGSVANLHAVGKTQRAVLKGGYFGPIDNEEINVDRQMIHQLWENPLSDDETMYATMDISSGKAENDKCPMIIWRGLQMVAIELFSGSPNELAGWIQQTLDKYGVSVSNFAFDATGHGYWVQAFTAGIPITWNKRAMQEYDANGNPVAVDEFFNLRSQLLGKTEVMLKSGLISCAIPKDKRISYGHKNELRQFIDILFDELALFTALQKNKKTYYRSTDEFKAKYKFSPDIMTTIALRSVFELKTKERKQPSPQVADDAYDDLFVPKPISSWGRRWN